MSSNKRRILKTAAAIVGISAMGAIGSGTAFAAIPTVPDGHVGGQSSASDPDQSIPVSSRSGDLHTFVTPTMAKQVAEPSTSYDDNTYNDDNSGGRSSDGRHDDNGSSGRSDDNGSDDNSSDDNSDSSYDDNGDYDNGYYDNGYYDNGYRHNDNGLLGGGLLGGNN